MEGKPPIRNHLKAFQLVLAFLALCVAGVGQARETIKVGVLHSLSGTMAISEVNMMETMLMLIAEQNQRGGVLGKQLEPVVMDPKSNWPLFEVRTRQLIEQEDVAVIFGCWTSVSRKAVLPVLEQLGGLLFYPVQYEGQESSGRVIYTGATPNQQAIPAVEYLREKKDIERWILLGTDYVYPRTTNRIIHSYLRRQGVAEEDIEIRYFPFGFAQWEPEIAKIRAYGTAGRKTAVISTINGDSNESFYSELQRQGVSADDVPVMAFSIGEEELTGIDTTNLAGHMATWSYFMSVDTAMNRNFIDRWRNHTGEQNRVTSDPMEAHLIGFRLWVQAVEKAGSADPDRVLGAIIGLSAGNLTGGVAEVLPNHHITKPVFIGEIQEDGQFKVVWRSDDAIAGDAWSDYLPESAGWTADWSRNVNCGKLSELSSDCLDHEPF